MSVNRTELVAQIAERADLTKAKADEALAAFQAVLVESLAKGEAVKVTGLLSVERVERAARTGRNPRTGEEIKIPAGYGVKLTAGATLKKAGSKCRADTSESLLGPDRVVVPHTRLYRRMAPMVCRDLVRAVYRNNVLVVW